MAAEWIVVADASTARIFSRTGAHARLSRVDALYHQQSRAHEGDLRTGGKGVVHDSAGSGAHQADPQTETGEKHADIFAKQVAEKLKAGLNDSAFESLIIAAEPKFLGRLRDHLDSPLTQRLTQTIDKNWTEQHDSQIEKYIVSQVDT